MADVDFREVEIAKTMATIVETLATQTGDIEIKIAALRAAAECLQQALQARTLSAMLAQTLLPKGR